MAKNSPANAGDIRHVGLIPWRRAWEPTPLFFLRESHGQMEPGKLQSIESDTTEDLACMHTYIVVCICQSQSPNSSLPKKQSQGLPWWSSG